MALEYFKVISFAPWGAIIPAIILSFIVFVVFSYLVPDKGPVPTLEEIAKMGTSSST